MNTPDDDIGQIAQRAALLKRKLGLGDVRPVQATLDLLEICEALDARLDAIEREMLRRP